MKGGQVVQKVQKERKEETMRAALGDLRSERLRTEGPEEETEKQSRRQKRC